MIQGLVDYVEDQLAVRVGLAFKHKGVIVRHAGIILDEELACHTIDSVVTVLVERYGAKKVDPLLLKTVIRFLPGNGRPRMLSGMTGGLIDRPYVRLFRTKDWPEDLGKGLYGALMKELDPDGAKEPLP